MVYVLSFIILALCAAALGLVYQMLRHIKSHENEKADALRQFLLPRVNWMLALSAAIGIFSIIRILIR